MASDALRKRSRSSISAHRPVAFLGLLAAESEFRPPQSGPEEKEVVLRLPKKLAMVSAFAGTRDQRKKPEIGSISADRKCMTVDCHFALTL